MTPATQRMVKGGVAIVLVAVVFYSVNMSELVQALRNLSVWLGSFLILLSIAMVYLSAVKWKLFLELIGRGAGKDGQRGTAEVSAFRLFHLYMVGYFVNLILPSYVGGDVVRSWSIGKQVGQHEALAATILERYTGLVAMIALAVIFVWFVPSVTIEIRLSVLAVAGGLAVITFVALSSSALRKLSAIPQLTKICHHLGQIQSGFRLARGRPDLLIGTLALSFLFHTLTVVNTMIAGIAVGWEFPPPLQLFVVLPLILLVSALPLSPQGLGIQEGAFYFFLQSVGATPAQALGVALILRAKSYLLSLWGGAVWWWDQRRIGAD